MSFILDHKRPHIYGLCCQQSLKGERLSQSWSYLVVSSLGTWVGNPALSLLQCCSICSQIFESYLKILSFLRFLVLCCCHLRLNPNAWLKEIPKTLFCFVIALLPIIKLRIFPNASFSIKHKTINNSETFQIIRFLKKLWHIFSFSSHSRVFPRDLICNLISMLEMFKKVNYDTRNKSAESSLTVPRWSPMYVESSWSSIFKLIQFCF